mmetsp:Transcript_29288/g.68034  ORF Transcript_29288/g.68034 Transcript_29288/m.68034 type:complete len:221 (+) Transcript_29288:62-724(+)
MPAAPEKAPIIPTWTLNPPDTMRLSTILSTSNCSPVGSGCSVPSQTCDTKMKSIPRFHCTTLFSRFSSWCGRRRSSLSKTSNGTSMQWNCSLTTVEARFRRCSWCELLLAPPMLVPMLVLCRRPLPIAVVEAPRSRSVGLLIWRTASRLLPNELLCDDNIWLVARLASNELLCEENVWKVAWLLPAAPRSISASSLILSASMAAFVIGFIAVRELRFSIP